MATGSLLRHLRVLVGGWHDARPSDGELLQRFAAERDEAAFAALVERHGPLVLGVARRVLRHDDDAEDVFQAAFLILARRAAALDQRGSLAGWLYTVAYHLALRGKSQAAKRRTAQTQVEEMAKAERRGESIWCEVAPLLDEELSRLPEKYRLPFLLCHVQGKTHAEAAAELGWPRGTLAGRLSRGRELLRARLRRRGLALSGGVLVNVVNAHAAVTPPPALAGSTVTLSVWFAAGKAVATSAGVAQVAQVAPVIELARGGLRAMLWTKLKTAAFISLLAAGVVVMGSLLAREAMAEKAPNGQTKPAAKPPAGAAQERAGDARKLQGTWRLISETHAGRDQLVVYEGASLEKSDGLRRLIIAGDNLASESRFHLQEKGSFKLDETAKPKTIDLTFGEPGAIDSTTLGVYEITGDTLTICFRYVPPDKPKTRPKALKVEQGANDVLRVFKREERPRAPRSVEEEKLRLARLRAGQNLLQIGIGIHEYADAQQHFPPPAIKAKDGTLLLSWRVAILPYLGHKELYDKFKLDQPWDSPHNKKLLEKMPALYAPAGEAPREPGMTFYQVFVGEGTCFEENKTLFFQDVTDGTVNTIMVVEAANPVPWTKPADLGYSSDKPVPELGGMLNDGLFSFLMADGSPRFTAKRAPTDERFQKLLRSLIVRNDGYALSFDELDR